MAGRLRLATSRKFGRTGGKHMVREIMRDVFFLAQKSDPATKADLQVARDLLDTLKAHTDECVGMAANIREGKVRERHACMDALERARDPYA